MRTHLGILTDWRNRKENVVLDGWNKFLECTKSGVFNLDLWIVHKLNYSQQAVDPHCAVKAN